MMKLAWLAWSVTLSGCSGSAIGEASRLETVKVASQLEVVRGHRVLFSHHSVGRDLIAGLSRVSTELTAKPLQVVSLEQASATTPSFVSISGGANQDPESKLAFFTQALRATSFEPDLAFMKFCYVDFNPSTDVDALFAAYQRTIATLRGQRPRTQFAHITVPLTARPTRLKDQLARLLGREVWEDAANVKRELFNQKLRDTYASDPLFDLARIESTRPDGSRATFEQNNRVYYALADLYTDDGGHLNRLGQDQAAIAFINFLSGALPRRSPN
jgi:hypothetical protein